MPRRKWSEAELEVFCRQNQMYFDLFFRSDLKFRDDYLQQLELTLKHTDFAKVQRALLNVKEIDPHALPNYLSATLYPAIAVEPSPDLDSEMAQMMKLFMQYGATTKPERNGARAIALTYNLPECLKAIDDFETQENGRPTARAPRRKRGFER